MMQKSIILAIGGIILSTICYCQTISEFDSDEKATGAYSHIIDMGLGFGLLHGANMGFGFEFTMYPVDKIGLVANMGVSNAGFQWNAGLKYSFFEASTKYWFRPNVKLLYGKNSATFITESDLSVNWANYEKTFSGITPSVGCELRMGKKKKFGLDVDLGFPIRSQKFHDHVDLIEEKDGVQDYYASGPVSLSAGLHLEFGRR